MGIAYIFNELLDGIIDVSIDNITTEASLNSCVVVSPNLSMSLILGPVRVAMRSLVPISK